MLGSSLSEEERTILEIQQRNPALQPYFPDHIKQRLLNDGLVRQTLGGTLALTDKGIMTALRLRSRR